MSNQTIEEGKTTAIISYLTIIGTIIAIVLNIEKKNPFASFHIRQALGLWLTFFLLGYVVGSFDSWLITLGFWIFFGVLFIFGFINAVAGKQQTVPLVGEFYQKLFSSIG
ncbi:MAG: hypothetical protein GW839_04345 [Flavobacteriales bacterium]|nr:hypothetical protein [Flavobacteriia bacterium]NCP05613.1 hypothetical protein [Flavobacteriales bacterium]PIV94681.1 MAG: hypothetical protein COW44_02940 [Flavobacteriaceae bacterium CG17_big_fil_post_rev_8_21_14_2_50_33_15]PIY10853.1 MAG: hypothetical protein COZ17_08415 [Flavobacteriaceae bacterium CG_4_10_14_3_um_filter_33_47]PJB20554.1 MAG: hypothetical protein CO117_00515 [Flavobacteriaceae bacterium CG_4_9_14_3_um_filter_33_16]